MMEDFTERMNQELCKQEALLAAQREQELLAQKQAAQEKEKPPNSDFRQLIEEMCGTKVCEEQKKKMEDTILELLDSKLLLIKLNSQHLNKEEQEVKNIAESAAKRQTRITPYHSEILSDDGTSSDDDDFEDIEYVDASPPVLSSCSYRGWYVILREKLLNINHLITNIESLNDNSTPDRVLKSPFPIPDSDFFFEKSDTSLSHLDNSLLEFETFSYHTEETSSGNTTTHANNSLPEYDSFYFEIEPD
ncbi:hypothetical protein Tco_1304914 [Tanacetum coccineum]